MFHRLSKLAVKTWLLPGAFWRGSLIQTSSLLPIVLVCALGTLDLVWNSFVHLRWNPPFLLFAAPAYIFFSLFVIVKIVWSNEIARELFLYLGLWVLFAIFGSQLSYLAATCDLPLRDDLLTRADSLLGFDWLYWFKSVWAHPPISRIFVWVYESYLFQPPILITLLAFAQKPGRNREFLIAMIIALLFVIVISAFLPAYGPPHMNGIATGWDDAMTGLRQGTRQTYGYVGIVTFPSFHACVAVLFTLAMRGLRLGLTMAAILNGVMLFTIIPLGGHYLVDVIAGCAVAALSFRIALLFNDPWKTKALAPFGRE